MARTRSRWGLSLGLSNAHHAHLERNFSVLQSSARAARFASASEAVPGAGRDLVLGSLDRSLAFVSPWLKTERGSGAEPISPRPCAGPRPGRAGQGSGAPLTAASCSGPARPRPPPRLGPPKRNRFVLPDASGPRRERGRCAGRGACAPPAWKRGRENAAAPGQLLGGLRLGGGGQGGRCFLLARCS